jgi:hypothetical protein
MQPAAASAFVQIKSTVGTKSDCRVKLSNALKAAQSPLPWFIVLYTKASSKKPASIYIKHVWREMIEKTLEKVRRVENLDTLAALHRTYLPIRMTETDKVDAADLVNWMGTTIRSIGEDYNSEKRAILRTVGFDDGFGVGTISLAGKNDEIIDNFLGLGNGLPGSDISLRLARFGIVDKEPLFALQNATVFITPTPVSSAEFRLRGGKPRETMSVTCEVYVVGEPILVAARRRFRFSGAGIEVIWSVDGHSKFTFNFNLNSRGSLVELDRLATVMHWHAVGPIDLQVWAFGRRALAGVLSEADPQPPASWEKIKKISRMLLSLTGSGASSDLLLSVKELNDAVKHLWFMTQVVTAPSMLVQCRIVIDKPVKLDKLLYFVSADAGSLTAFAIIERRVRQERPLPDGRVEFICDHADIKESWVVSDAENNKREMMESDYSLFASAADSGATLSIGDIYQVYIHGAQGNS